MIKISSILDFLKAESIPFSFIGNSTECVDGFSSLARYKSGSFTWVKSAKNIPEGFDLNQTALIFLAEGIGICPSSNIIRTPESKRAFFSTIEHFYAQEEERPAVGQFTYISPRVTLGKNVRIGHNCTLDGDITIGDGTIIWNNVVIINRVQIGKNCDIHSGAVIGHDGFGYTEDDAHKKTMVKHFGGVLIGDDVLVSDNVCICRGTIDDTVIASGTKIDNLSHIAHNCILEEGVALAYPCRLGGSTHIMQNGYLSGATTRNQSVIGKCAVIGLGAVVVKDVDSGLTVVGIPAKPFAKKECE